MKGSLAIFVAALGLFLPGAAFGLSCARPSLDETAIDAAIMISEGTAGPKRSLDFRERAVVRMHTIEAKGGTTEDLRVYSFTVTPAHAMPRDVATAKIQADTFARPELPVYLAACGRVSARREAYGSPGQRWQKASSTARIIAEAGCSFTSWQWNRAIVPQPIVLRLK